MYKPEYILALGDNFYRFGVRSIDDPAWEDVFENVYDSDELMCPWYPVTGNHDWGNNEDCGDAGNWTAQILYSWGFTQYLELLKSRKDFNVTNLSKVKNQSDGPFRICFIQSTLSLRMGQNKE